MEGITIKKTTLAFVGLALVLLLGAAYMALGAGSANGVAGTGGQDRGQNGNGTIVSPSGTQAPSQPQDIYIRALSGRTYSTQEIHVTKGVPVRLHFTADTNAGCGRQMVVYGLGVSAVSRNGEESVVEFTPQEAGTYEYNCGMRMWQPGRLIVS